MDNFEKKINSNERLPNVESSKEAEKNKEMTPEDKAAATMERADILVKEVKTSKQQMQNIMINVGQVLQAIKDLRAQLQIVANNDESISSVEQDKKAIEKLKKKISGHTDELLKMKEELITIHISQMSQASGIEINEDMKNKAREVVENLIAEVTS